jgi:ubiquinone/menaquinone biosynthesis C-methylase UbiE
MLTRILVAAVAGGALALAVVGWRFSIFILPVGWSGELDTLAGALRIAPGQVVADIGAGDGALAAAMAKRVGPGGVVYATELSIARREAIAARVSKQGLDNVRVVEAAADETRLANECCDAVYLRTVFHHIGDKGAFARSLARTVRTGGRVAVIDFPPGALWFHEADHGVSAATVIDACYQAGLRLVQQSEDWGGGTYLLVFERR